MKKFLKFTGILMALVILAVGALAVYVKSALPDVGPPENLVIKSTPEKVQRGEYLANSVAVCMDCHSEREGSIYAAPLKRSTFGAGGEKFGPETGFPGTVYSKNITPYGLGNWTDGEIFRAITTGVRKDGTALFPIMPYHNYGKLDRDDIESIIAYLRTLPPLKSEFPTAELEFPLNFLINTMPVKDSLSTRPDPADEINYGKYLVTAASCMVCHSKEEKGEIIPGTEFGGGREFKLPVGGTAITANITPDKETGIGTWSRDIFISRFKQYTDSSHQPRKVMPGEANTPMPWYMYASMTENDLGAIYAFLQTVKPISNKVIHFRSDGAEANAK